MGRTYKSPTASSAAAKLVLFERGTVHRPPRIIVVDQVATCDRASNTERVGTIQKVALPAHPLLGGGGRRTVRDVLAVRVVPPSHGPGHPGGRGGRVASWGTPTTSGSSDQAHGCTVPGPAAIRRARR
jgi:hypothetical protein